MECRPDSSTLFLDFDALTLYKGNSSGYEQFHTKIKIKEVGCIWANIS
jgi:hypothetical protein